jgi:urea transport system permease protein
VVTILPEGVLGWLRSQGVKQMLGKSKKVSTYPSLEQNPEEERERENTEN